MHLSLYRDQAGDLRAHCPPPYTLLGHFLESDVQGNTVFCHDILQAITRIAAGTLDTWQATGNAHTLVLTADGARIEADWASSTPPCQLSLADLRTTLERWGAFLNP
jgi:uncharacterized protein YacL (UPF0231 family)